MTRKNKLLKRFLRNPQALKYREIETILLDLGFSKRTAKGSHVIFSFPEHSIIEIVSVHNNDCRPSYKKAIAKIIIKYFI